MTKTLTIKDKTFDCDYAGIGYMAWLKAQIADARSLSEIAPDVEGADVITLKDDHTGENEFEGYTQLMRIERIDPASVMIMLAKEDDQE